MDGFETCRRLKADEHAKDIPVIFMTGLDDALNKVRGFELGGVDYIAKPCHPEELWAQVNTHLQIRQLLQQFETLANATFEGIVIHEDDGRIIYVNQRIQELFGCERAEDVPDHNILGLITQESRHDAEQRIRMKDDDPYQVEGVRKDGTSFPVEIQARPILYGGQEARVAAIRDLSWLRSVGEKTSKGLHRLGDLLGKSDVMQKLYGQIMKFAESDSTVLILGESGSGKELIARTLHELGKRSQASFVAVNCGALPESLVESELFGYRKGAFTEAKTNKPGAFTRADGGTLFLDEIGELSPALQVKLLRALQEKTYLPLGAAQEEHADVRIILATNQNPEQKLQEGLLREDFYFRINRLKILAPPLRERKEDVPMLIDHFLKEYSAENNCPCPKIPPKSLIEQCCQYNWPGNVRELESEIERYAFGEPLEFIGNALPSERNSDDPPFERSLSINPDGMTLQEARDAFEQAFICAALQKNAWRKGETAEELGISPKALYNKIHKYGLDHGK